MKVLFVESVSADVDDRNVIARRQIPLFQALAARGVDLTVVVFGDASGLSAGLRAAGIATRVLQPYIPPSAAGIGALPAAIVRLRRVIREVRPDIVDGDEPLPAIAAGLAALGTGSVRIYRRHHHPHGRRPLAAAGRLAARLTAWTVVSNEVMAQYVEQFERTPRERILVARSGTLPAHPRAAEQGRAIRKSLGIPDDARVIGVVSRLRREKGIDVLLRSLSLLSSPSRVHCFIAGTGPEEDELRRLASGAGVPVHFAGYQDEVHEWLAAADVVVIPSRSESFGRVTLEAMAAGKPLVASRAGGLQEAIVDGETGVLIEPGSESALARALDSLLDDDERRHRLGAAARQRWETHYTMEKMADSWLAAWTRSLSRQR